VFANRYGMENQWKTYTLCRAYCALGFEAADGTPQLQYFVFYRCRRDGYGEMFVNQTSLDCKEQKCETFGPEWATFARSASLIENGVLIRNETVQHVRKALLFGDTPCCANANVSMPVMDFDSDEEGACAAVVKTCIPTGDSQEAIEAKGACK
jgi:hypothetical protein